MKVRWIYVLLGFALLVIIASFSKTGIKPSQVEATTVKKGELIPDRVMSVSDPDDEYVSILMGTDDSHFVRVVIDRLQVQQGLQTSVPRDIGAVNGNNNMYEHAPKKFGTETLFTINTLTPKNKTAMVTIAAKLVSSKPGQGDYLTIPPTTLFIKGQQFDNLIAKYKR